MVYTRMPSDQLKIFRRLDYVILAAFAGALLLSILSWMRICSHACLEGHNYLLFGWAFEPIGVAVFSMLIVLLLLSKWVPWLSYGVGCGTLAILGAEAVFIYIQKYQIGSWCPLCLSIAACMVVAGMLELYKFVCKEKFHM